MPLKEITHRYNGYNITRCCSMSEKKNTCNILIHFPILSEQSYYRHMIFQKHLCTVEFGKIYSIASRSLKIMKTQVIVNFKILYVFCLYCFLY